MSLYEWADESFLVGVSVRRKIVLKKKEDRQKAASFIKEESHKLGNLFQRLSHATSPAVSVCV